MRPLVFFQASKHEPPQIHIFKLFLKKGFDSVEIFIFVAHFCLWSLNGGNWFHAVDHSARFGSVVMGQFPIWFESVITPGSMYINEHVTIYPCANCHVSNAHG
jgi:hypothetical protein